jgi:hypothetical protein
MMSTVPANVCGHFYRPCSVVIGVLTVVPVIVMPVPVVFSTVGALTVTLVIVIAENWVPRAFHIFKRLLKDAVPIVFRGCVAVVTQSYDKVNFFVSAAFSQTLNYLTMNFVIGSHVPSAGEPCA